MFNNQRRSNWVEATPDVVMQNYIKLRQQQQQQQEQIRVNVNTQRQQESLSVQMLEFLTKKGISKAQFLAMTPVEKRKIVVEMSGIPEGGAVYDPKIGVVQRRGAGTSADNPIVFE
jgi:sulfatase maturation enzyme AslB (radical SAM superfamily)